MLFDSTEWLENRVNEMTNTAVLLVSHDRAFIDNVCPDILELDGVGGSHRHRGGYAAYLEGRAARWAGPARSCPPRACLCRGDAQHMAGRHGAGRSLATPLATPLATALATSLAAVHPSICSIQLVI